MRKFLMLFLITILSCKTTKIKSGLYTNEMKQELKTMYKQDQEIQKLLISSIESNQNQKKIDSIDILIPKIFNNNYIKVKKYFDLAGFPGIKENDKFTSFAFWLLVQHCDKDVNFQQSVLNDMKRHLKNNNVNISNYAYLYDRVQKNLGKAQLFGTQKIRNSDGIYIPYKLLNPKYVNKRRQKYGLNSIEEYLEGKL